MALCLPVATIIEGVGYFARGIDYKISASVMANIRSELEGLSDIELDFISEKTRKCRYNKFVIADNLITSKIMLAIKGITSSELSQVSDRVRNYCLKEYIVKSPSNNELLIRNKQVGHLSPYSKEDLAFLLISKPVM